MGRGGEKSRVVCSRREREKESEKAEGANGEGERGGERRVPFLLSPSVIDPFSPPSSSSSSSLRILAPPAQYWTYSYHVYEEDCAKLSAGESLGRFFFLEQTLNATIINQTLWLTVSPYLERFTKSLFFLEQYLGE